MTCHCSLKNPNLAERSPPNSAGVSYFKSHNSHTHTGSKVIPTYPLRSLRQSQSNANGLVHSPAVGVVLDDEEKRFEDGLDMGLKAERNSGSNFSTPVTPQVSIDTTSMDRLAPQFQGVTITHQIV